MRRVFSLRATLAAGALALCVFEPAACLAGDVHALVIGINDYDHQQKLEGAVADAEDIAGALRGIGARSLVLLKDHEASRQNITESWLAVTRQAKPGDTIVFTYAGHGGQEPYTPPGKVQELLESFLFAAFTPKGPMSAERILDKEINAWLKRAGEQGLRVIFIADACHSGGMLRSMDGRAAVTHRSVPPYGIPDVLLSSDDLKQGADLTFDDLPHVTFFSATQADLRSPEVLIGGQKRGALSYAFARALEGAADRRGDGTLSQLELAGYISATVRQLSEAQQTPEIVYRSGSEHEPLLSGIPRFPERSSQMEAVRLRLVNADAAAREGLKHSLVGASIVNDGDAVDLVWDAKERTVVSQLGDPVAHAIVPTRLQGVIDKWRILPVLKGMALKHPLAMSLKPSDARHPIGRVIEFESAPLPFPNVTVFNLTSDGGIQFLYPKLERPEDARNSRVGEPYRLPLTVEPPVGADHLFVIASASPLEALRGLLRAAPSTLDVPQLLHDALAGTDYAMGLQGLYTTDDQEAH